MKKLLSLIVITLLLTQSMSIVYAWQIERPNTNENLYAEPDYKRAQNSSTDDNASVGLGIALGHYSEHWIGYGGADLVDMNISMTANSRKGISYKWYGGDYYWIDEDDLTYGNENVTMGDNNGTWIDIPQNESALVFRFYGGLYSFEYRRVWVCTNGLVYTVQWCSFESFPKSLSV